MSSSWGHNIKISIFGESHGKAIGVVVDGLPAGLPVNENFINFHMQRRAPGRGIYSTKRVESDIPDIQSGVLNGYTTGAPICAIIKNSDNHSRDYNNLLTSPRPGHSDYTAFIRYEGQNDVRGGGHFSGRLTAPMVFAGSLCRLFLEEKGIIIGGHLSEVAGIQDSPFDAVNINEELLHTIARKEFPVIDDLIGRDMLQKIGEAVDDMDSVGGVVECAVTGLKAGLGNPMFDSIESVFSSILFSVPAVKGVEFGKGFDASRLKGSQHNDPFYMEDGICKTTTNHAGGILGGISTGMPVIVRTAFKPTASIYKKQQTINLETKENTEIQIKGRHDPCVAVRAVPVVESACAIALTDIILSTPKNGGLL